VSVGQVWCHAEPVKRIEQRISAFANGQDSGKLLSGCRVIPAFQCAYCALCPYEAKKAECGCEVSEFVAIKFDK